MQIITKRQKQEAAGGFILLNELVKYDYIDIEYAKPIFYEYLNVHINLWPKCTVIKIPQPTTEQLLQQVRNGDIYLIKQHKKLRNLITIDDIKTIVKTNRASSDISWIPKAILESPKFRAWVYNLKRDDLNERLIRYMTIDELNIIFKPNGAQKPHKIYKTNDEFFTKRIRIYVSGKTGVVPQRIAVHNLKGEKILDINTNLRIFNKRILPRLKYLIKTNHRHK